MLDLIDPLIIDTCNYIYNLKKKSVLYLNTILPLSITSQLSSIDHNYPEVQ